jgi:hypothetical protein
MVSTPIPVPLGPASDKAKSAQGGGSLITNGYVEQTEGGKSNYSINTRPRLKLFSTVYEGNAGRGAVALGNNLYVVCGERLSKVNQSGVPTTIGTVLGQSPVSISTNRKAPYEQITITADTKSYYLENDVLTLITDPDLPTIAHSNCFVNGRTVYGFTDGTYYISAENDTGNVDALDFAEAERSADRGVRVFSYGEDFWYFGEASREIMRYTGDTFPFAPLLGAGQGEGEGLSCKNSVAISNKVVVWVSDYGHVVASTGGPSTKISTHRVDRDIERVLHLGLQDEVTAFSYGIEGHQFYFLRCSLWCWMYDFATGFWYPVSSYLSDTFKAGYYVYAYNKDLVLDATDGKLYELTFDEEDDDDDPCILQIETSPVNAFPDGYICDAFHLDIQAGVGIASGAAHVVDPQVILNVSADGGMTWGNDYQQSAGQQGKYATQLRFNRLGKTNGRGMAFRVSFPEPVERAVFGAAIDVRKLAG